MPNHYDVDVNCRNCGKYLFSFLHSEDDHGQRYCGDKCERKGKKKLDKRTERARAKIKEQK